MCEHYIASVAIFKAEFCSAFSNFRIFGFLYVLKSSMCNKLLIELVCGCPSLWLKLVVARRNGQERTFSARFFMYCMCGFHVNS